MTIVKIPMKAIRTFVHISCKQSFYQRQTLFKETPASKRFLNMSAAKEFPPEKVRAIVQEVASLLKERKESVSVAETVSIGCSLKVRELNSL